MTNPDHTSAGLPSEQAAQEYQQMVKQIKPKPTILKNCVWAFVSGGIICTIGQSLINLFRAQGMDPDKAGSATVVVLVFSAALLTGLGLYEKLGKYAGAGTIVPITGFANAMVAPALEYKHEGMILGMAARLFSIAGPVLVFGFMTSWLIGLATYLMQ